MTTTLDYPSTAASPRAWMMSLALHGLVVGLIALVAYTANLHTDKPPRALILVAGPGEDYGAKEAPAFGSETGLKVDIPKIAAPAPPAPVQPVRATAPTTPPPTPKTQPKQKELDPAKNMARDLKARVQQAERKAKKEAAIERKKEQDRITKEQFDRDNAAKKVASAAPPKSQPGKFKPIDTKGIARGVVGGSSASTKGAGGKALTRDEANLLELYDAEFLLKLRRAFEEDRPPGLSDALGVTVEVRSNPDGSLSNMRVTKPSGSAEFDRAVLAAVRKVRMGPRPDKKVETLSFIFTMRDE